MGKWNKLKVRLTNIITLFVLIISSCSHVSFEPGRTELQNFTSAEQEKIVSVLKTLNVYQKKPFVFRKVNLGEYTLGLAYNFTFQCYVELNTSIFTNDYFNSVLYHEVGHCLGLSHSPNPNDVMYKEARFFNEYTPLDLQRYFKQLNSCF